MKIYLIVFLVIGFVFLLTFTLSAQPPPMLPGDPQQSPIDGGLTVLAAAGGAYAWKRFRNKSV